MTTQTDVLRVAASDNRVGDLADADSDAEPGALRWRFEELPFERIDRSRVNGDESMFFLLAGASFVEIASDLYTANLLRCFEGDAEVSIWLKNHWEPEEVQHGRALRAYVGWAWPEFDWSAAFERFLVEYAPLCTVDDYEATRGLEMAARCAIETGTSVFYRALNELTDEPVLKQLTELIRRDEVRHYKQFHRFFRKYEAIEHNGRRRIFGALARRMMAIRQSDADIAVRHVFDARYPAIGSDSTQCRRLISELGARVRQHYPLEMAAKMLAKPLDLPPGSGRVYLPLARVAQRLLN